MSVFKHKLDFENDLLRLDFSLEDMQYSYYKIREKVPYDSLNKRTKKQLIKENKKLVENPNLLQGLITNKKLGIRYTYLKSRGFGNFSFQTMGKLHGTISNEMNTYLEQLTSKENTLIGIHRLKPTVSNIDIIDILNNGLRLSGHTAMGTGYYNVELSDNVSYYADNKQIITEVINADTYEKATGSILIEIPDEELGENIYFTDSEGFIRIKPKYILGYIPLENHHVSKIITANQIQEYFLNNNNNYPFTLQFNEKTELYENDEAKGKNR